MAERTLQRVVQCLADVTRYPTELLTADADLENDLGIDSVKLVEIVVALSEEFQVGLQDKDRDPAVRTIAQLAEWIDRIVDQEVVDEDVIVQDVVDQGNAGQNGVRHLERPNFVQNGHLHVHAAHTAPTPAVPHPQDRLNGREAAPPPSARPLAGRTAFVTGSGRGVGRTFARVLAARGATVLVNSFHSRDQGEQTVEEIKSQGGEAFHLWGSVANPEHVDAMFDQIDDQFGLDILVCNASDGRIGSFLDLTSDDWDRAFRTNVSGHYQCAVRAARSMRARGGGSIVTMSAVGAHQFIDGLGSQGVVKAAVESMTRYLACSLGPFGIRVNCVAGGPVYGDLLAKFPHARAAQNHWESMAPDGELCNPMDLAYAAAFLVSEEARGINGSVWMIDHGFSATADGRPLHRTLAVNGFAAATPRN